MSDTHQTPFGIAHQITIPSAPSALSAPSASRPPSPPEQSDPNELAQLSMMIKAWRENQKETEQLNAQMKEKKKQAKVMEDVILRVMKKNNIGALDLQTSGGRLLYRRQTTKAGLSQKEMARLLAEHMKSEQAANTALQYIAEHRGSKVKESLLFEKE